MEAPEAASLANTRMVLLTENVRVVSERAVVLEAVVVLEVVWADTELNKVEAAASRKDVPRIAGSQIGKLRNN